MNQFILKTGQGALSRAASWCRDRRGYLMLAIAPILVFYTQEWFTHNPWTTMYLSVQLWNFLLYEMVFWGLFLLIGRSRPALWLGTLLFAFIGSANYFVMEFRDAPIVPWDIYSIRTAASVADNYRFELTTQALLVLVVFALLMVAYYFFPCSLKDFRLTYRILLLALLGFLGLGYVKMLHKDSFIKEVSLDNTLFTPHVMARKNGFLVSFLMDLRYMHPEAPEGYSPEEVEEFLTQYPDYLETYQEILQAQDDEYEWWLDPDFDEILVEDEAEDSLPKEEMIRPDIIVIMDEAFSDPAVLGDFTSNMDYMPYLHSLQQDDDPGTITGYLNVSVKGGNTANSEYEFLTGNSMHFLPAGSVPYQQYIFDEKNTIPSWLKKLGYECTAIHPFNSTGWNRNLVYDYFGFDNKYFISNFHNPSRLRKYVDDKACFDRILQQLEDRETYKTPQFIFAVTMQNHGGYSEDFDNFQPDITVEGVADKSMLCKYLSLMKVTDQALEDLIYELSYSPRPTLVVFFGDHQPNDWVVEPIFKMQGTSTSELPQEERPLQYKVPYLIWANYEMKLDEMTFDADKNHCLSETSANYLGMKALQLAGLPLASHQQALLEIADMIPVISAQNLLDTEGQRITEDRLEDSTLRHFYDLYHSIQYYEMNEAAADPRPEYQSP